MKTSLILLLFLSIYTLFSCSSQQTSTSTVNPHVAAHQQFHDEFKQEEKNKVLNEKYLKEITGTYLGVLPCADCEKIIYRLQLNDDKTYQTETTYQGKSDEPIIKNGTFTINVKQQIQLDDQAGTMKLFQKENYGLLLLDKNGNKISGDLAEKYRMLPVTREISNNKNTRYQKIMQKKYQEGIDFYAFGNEPFWSLDMDFEKTFRFKNLDGLEFNVPAVQPEKAMDTDVNRYRSVTESGEIIIQLIHSECTDSMSGQKFDYGVDISLKNGNAIDFTNYKGCGNFVPDYRLHNIWAIVEVDGINVNPKNFKKEFPRIEININKKKVLGNDGCNNFNGNVKVENKTISFGNLASTMIACFENTEISSKIVKILSNKNLTYKYEKNLVFYDQSGKKVMELKNID